MDWKDFTLCVGPPLVQILKQQNHHGFIFVFSFNRSFYLKQKSGENDTQVPSVPHGIDSLCSARSGPPIKILL